MVTMQSCGVLFSARPNVPSVAVLRLCSTGPNAMLATSAVDDHLFVSSRPNTEVAQELLSLELTNARVQSVTLPQWWSHATCKLQEDRLTRESMRRCARPLELQT